MATAQKLACRVDRILRHGDGVYTVALEPERPAPRFRAGQFLHLALDPYDPTRFWPESRAFSIASAPAQRDLLRISYSVRGGFTARMERDLAEGVEVWIKMPYGEFVIDSHADAVLFAGGTGITAFTAFIEGLTPDRGQRVVLAYGARNSTLLVYRDVVERAARTSPTLNVTYFVEQGETEAGARWRESSSPQLGRVSVAAMWPQLRQPEQAHFYISGPPAMLQTIARDLKSNGIPGDRIHIDAWE
jgi:ferredoxin-NADP reductase